MNLSPKYASKINKSALSGRGTFATIEQMREAVCNFKLNDESLPPDLRARVDALCLNILGI